MDLEGIEIINSYLLKIKATIEGCNINLHEYAVFYRGESQNYSTTIPGVFRCSWLIKEHELFRELELRYPNIFDHAKSTFDKLAVMQHHGLPTRLLDFTTNPLLALYMAIDTQDMSNFCPTIKIIFVKKDTIKYYDSDTVSVLANFAKANIEDIKVTGYALNSIISRLRERIIPITNGDRPIERIMHSGDNTESSPDGVAELAMRLEALGSTNTDTHKFERISEISHKLDKDLKSILGAAFCESVDFTHFILHLIKDEKPYFKDMIWMEHFNKTVIFVKPKHNSERLINQAGIFALFGLDKGKKSNFALEDCKGNDFEIESFPLCECVHEKRDMCNNEYISQLKTALGILGITKDKVYPEMEHASAYIKELFRT